MSLYPESLTILARAGRVDIGPPASGRRATVMRILTAVGNTLDDRSSSTTFPSSGWPSTSR